MEKMRKESITYKSLKYLKTCVKYQLNKSEKEECNLIRAGKNGKMHYAMNS